MHVHPRETVTIRPERPADPQAALRVNRDAFGGETEPRLVEALRASPFPVLDPALVPAPRGRLPEASSLRSARLVHWSSPA